LRAIAGALVEAAWRPADLVARYGGEAFAAIPPETAVEVAKAMAQRLQAKVRELSVLHGAKAAASIVTVSIGGAVARWCQGVSIAELLAVADRQLYRAKAAGGDLSFIAVV
jgi:diguanylate cyclase (GGDEF)-like protein